MHRMIAILVASASLTLGPAALAQTDWTPVGQALGRDGTLQGDIYRVGLPRTDLKVSVDGVDIKPTLALGGWLAFRSMGADAMVMGDLVLTQQELNPVMARLAQDGIEITAIHNHLLRAEPFTLYMHVSGRGDPVMLATHLHDALSLSATPLTLTTASSPPATLDLDQNGIERALGRKGKVNGGVLQFGIARGEPVKDEGMEVPEAMGSAISINMQPTGGGKVAATGDFVLTAGEVNPVLRELRSHGIEVTALHNHMLADEPRLFFMHFWAHDDAAKVAAGLRAGLDKVSLAPAR
ncbi:DUF1259 domain-containing protein [Alsobacter sp. SYSU M60028]|uniref:DUF1259 domain-containing protein n=1 Tax=Alsobacter ponti TaxID=2962936 RepID=A0ABT1L7P2_9HYPH|nr:DUF1259 domain-containing protein [Alsobacter ponti]MCP8937389.1 DUF1259 domain-containing protein [Alsobacter ponti]